MPGVDFEETFTPVTHLDTNWSVLHIGVTNDQDIDHLNVKMAFLIGNLYQKQPKRAKEVDKEGWVCYLNKSLYNLRQASQQWSKKLYDCLMKEEEFTCCTAEHSIYTCKDKTGTAILAVHVNDMPLTVLL